MKKIKLYILAGTAAAALAACCSDGFKFNSPSEDAALLKAQKSEIFVPYKKLTQGPYKHWFAYYDKLEVDPTGRYVLAMRTSFEGRRPRIGDKIETGMIDLKDNCKWIKLGESDAWGWQQGCQLQFIPNTKSKVIWNDREKDKFVARIKDIETGELRTIDSTVYALSPDGKWAVTVDYSRVNDMRPGYGYAGFKDKYESEKFPAESGIFKVDLQTGARKLIISHADVMKIPNALDPDFADAKHWFNHLLVSPDGKRFIFLHRWRYPDEARTKKYKGVGGFGTRMFTADADGKNLRVIDPYNYTSHFIWDTESKNVVAWTRIPGKGDGFFVIEDSPTENIRQIGKGVMLVNGHNTFLNSEWIVNDTYPDKNRHQTVYLYNVKTGKRYDIAKLYEPREGFRGEFRCDTHPRHTPDGKKIIVDSAHDGGRQIYMFDISEIVK